MERFDGGLELRHVQSAVATECHTTHPKLRPHHSRTNDHSTRISNKSTIGRDVLYFATLTHALLVAVNANTGALLGQIKINAHPLAILTMSPTVYRGRIFIGASSNEEAGASVIVGYPCCSFVGNMVALIFDHSSNVFTVAWNISMLPDPPGDWSGAALWGSQPAIDPARSQVMVATGNVYFSPEDYLLCQNQSQSITVVAEGLTADPCLPSDVLQESVVAIDIELGLINWVNQLSPLDAWTIACGEGPTHPHKPIECPETPGPDADFWMAPSFIAGGPGTPYGKDTVVVGQKNGILHALNAQTGRVFWSVATSTGGQEGGLIWGLAVDDTQVYFTAVNANFDTWQLRPSNISINNSALGAASLKDGSLVWETAVPQNGYSIQPPSVANDVGFFGRSYENATGNYSITQGGLLILDTRRGHIVRDIPLDTEFRGGVAVKDQYVMFGTGYSKLKETGSFYVFSL